MEPESDLYVTMTSPFLADACDVAPCILTHRRQSSYIRDHRKLRHSFLQDGAAAVAIYKFLELELFWAIPRQDVKPLAR